MLSLAALASLPLAAVLSAAPLAAPPAVQADGVGSLVSVSVRVDGGEVAIYRAVDGSDRWYLAAAEGSDYAVTLTNRTPERLGVVLSVDGLNVISGERQPAPRLWWGDADPGRMYVLEPWDETTVSGWRTSLEEVRRFTFVDERASYAARSGKANAKMGWIEIAVYRERDRPRPQSRVRDEEARGASEDAAAQPPAAAKPSREPDAVEMEGRRSYPGTGWGERTEDAARLVEFEPERRPAERITLRYEYPAALIQLGVLPVPSSGDRLAERDGARGFAKAPAR